MRVTVLVVLLLLSQSVFALTQCGDSIEDRRYPSLDWIKASHYQANSSYIKLRGILCAGVHRGTNTIERIHYRDDSGVKVLASKKQLLAKDVTFLRRSDFPIIAQMVTRDVDPLTMKVTSERKLSSYTDYVISLKFVRNMGKGFSKTDIRNLKVNARLHKNGKLDVYYGSAPTSRTLFDLITLNIGGDLKVSTVMFYDGQSLIQSLSTSSLPKASRR